MSYSPGTVPTNPADLPGFLRQELLRISNELTNVLTLPTLYAAPSRIYEGQIVKADGATWNPGSGAGIYARISGAWVKL